MVMRSRDIFENMKAHDVAFDLERDFQSRTLSEADTRHQIIDPILHEVLGWPRSRTRCEEFIAPGYADYVLERSDGAPIILIEAKKEGDYFDVPAALIGASLATYVKVKTLLTDVSIGAALMQVRDYV